jgi:hypothetical protein
MSPQDRTFGRRSPPQDQVRRPANAVSPPPAASSQASGRPLMQFLALPGVRQIAGITLGVAIMFGLIMIYVSGMKTAGRALGRQWEENAGYPALDSPSARRAGAGLASDVRTTCKARAEQVKLNAATRRDLDYYVDIWVGEEQVMQHAAFIACLVSTQPARFCQPEHGGHLAGAMRDYFRLRLRVREEWTMARNNPFGAAQAGLMPLPGAQGINARFPSERTDPDIVAGLTRLITDGYLTRADLGAGMFSRMPGDLETQLTGVERNKRSCG